MSNICQQDFDYKNFREYLDRQIIIIGLITLDPKIFHENFLTRNETLEIEYKITTPMISWNSSNNSIFDSQIKSKIKEFVDNRQELEFLITDKFCMSLRRYTEVKSIYKDQDEINTCEVKNNLILKEIETDFLNRVELIISCENINNLLCSYLFNYTKIMFAKIGKNFHCFFLKEFLGNYNENFGTFYGLYERVDFTLDQFMSSGSYNYNLSLNNENKAFKFISKKEIKMIMKQIIGFLYSSQKRLCFFHGDLITENILVSMTPVNVCCEGNKIMAPFTLKVYNFSKSSCELQKEDTRIRFGCVNQNKIQMQDASIKLFQIQDEFFYRVESEKDYDFIKTSNFLGYPYYLSYDYYSILLDLMKNEKFKLAFFSEEMLIEKFWNPCFYGNDLIIMKNKIFTNDFNYSGINLKMNCIRQIHNEM